MITRPVRERPAEQVRTMVDRGPAPHRLRRGGAHVAVHRRLLRHRGRRRRTSVDDPARRRPVSVSLPRLRVDAFTVGIAGRDPEGPPHRPHLRPRGRHLAHAPGHQQADPRGGPLRRGRLRLLAGLAADEALLPHRPAHRDRRGHARHRRAGPQLRRDRPASTTRTPSVTVVGRRVRAQAVHPVPVVRPEHARGAAAARSTCCATTLRRDQGRAAQVARPQGHRWSRASPAAATAASAPVIEEVWRDGGTFQEWSEHFDLDLWLDAMSRHGLDLEWYVYRHRTEDEVLPWDHLSAGLHKDFLWQDWRDALAEVGLEDCRWTPCYDCGACTGYGIEHVVASAVPPAGGSQGTGQDLAAAARCRSLARGPSPIAPCRHGGCRDAGPAALHQAGQGPLHQPPRRGPHLGAGAAPGRAPVAYTEGFSPRPKLHFGLALSTGHESLAEYLDVDLVERRRRVLEDAARAGSTPLLPARHRRRPRPRRSSAGTPSLQQAVTAARGGSRCCRRRRPTSAAAVDRGARPPTTLVVTRERKGQDVTDDIRPSVLDLAVVGPTADGHRARRRARPPSPAGCARPSCSPRSAPARPRGRPGARRAGSSEHTNGSQRDGARREPLPAARRRAPHAEARAS